MKKCIIDCRTIHLLVIFSTCWLAGPLAAQPGPQERATQLAAGMKLDLTLAPPDENVYTAELESGAALIAEVIQDGIDLVIDVYGPDGQRMSRLDSPNGQRGPEPILVTALRSGSYKLTVHSLQRDAKPGKYVMKVEQILGPVENAKRLAKERFPTQALYDLWESSLTDPTAVEKFLSDHKQSGPIIEAIPGNVREMQVTYFCLGDPTTERAELSGGPDYLGMEMSRLGRTDLYFVRQVVPNDARFVYQFILHKVTRAGPAGIVELTDYVYSDDFVMEMPNAPAQPYITKRKSVPNGTTVETTIMSSVLEEERKITVYTPAGYDGKTDCNLLIVFDGEMYGSLLGQTQGEVPTPTILDHLIAEKKIGPTVGILVWSMGKRFRDLPGSKPFADFIADEVVPWARSHHSILPGPNGIVVAGASLGAYCATYCAFNHPDVIGNVVSQSGAYWVSKDWQTVDAGFERRLYPRDTGTMIEAFKTSNRLPIRFFMEIGIYDLGAAMLGSNRELRDVLQLKGYDVDYREFMGGHNTVNWRGSLADGLISLLGRNR